MSGGPAEESVVNIASNLIVPFNPQNIQNVSGTVLNVAGEVVVSRLLRQLSGVERRSWFDLIAIHSMSQPFLGAFNWFAAPTGLNKTPGVMQAAQDGAKEVPAVLAAMYVGGVARKGFAIPSFGVKDLLMILASKMIHRVLVGQAYTQLNQPWLQTPLQAHDDMIVAQYNKSRVNKKMA